MDDRHIDPALSAFVQLMLRLGVLHPQVHPLVVCTRCGGDHSLSQCKWPTGNRTTSTR
jgi:hypothetical protein